MCEQAVAEQVPAAGEPPPPRAVEGDAAYARRVLVSAAEGGLTDPQRHAYELAHRLLARLAVKP